MDKTNFLKAGALLFFMAILFTPQNSDTWLYFFIPGIIMGVWWFIRIN